MIDERTKDYFKRNPIAYALALEPKHNDKDIKRVLEISKWYSSEEIENTMKQLINGRKAENERQENIKAQSN